MSTQKYVSDIKTVNWDNKIFYEKLSNYKLTSKRLLVR